MKHKEQSIAALVNLRALIEREGVTHKEIADRIGIRRQSVMSMLNRRFSPTLDTVFQALNALNEVAGTGYGLKDLDSVGANVGVYVKDGNAIINGINHPLRG